MDPKTEFAAERAREAAQEEIPAILAEADEGVLAALLENPRLDQSHLALLLERKNLSGTLLEAIARRKQWLSTYAIKKRIVFHPHAPRLVAMRLARELYLMDLVQLSLLPGVPGELRRLAEEWILARLPQLPLGQKLALARRGSARVAGGLVAEGHEQVVRVALDNAFLNEAQLLKVLARSNLPVRVMSAIARHRKWSCLYNVRVALLRHPQAPVARVLAFLPDLTLRDLRELSAGISISPGLRTYLRKEISRRSRAGAPAPRGRTQ